MTDEDKIIQRIAARFHDETTARAWFQSVPLPGFSDCTAMDLVRSGRSAEVLDLIDAIDAGIHA